MMMQRHDCPGSFPLLLLALLLLIGCGDSTGPEDTPDDTPATEQRGPGLGSTYDYEVYLLDDFGNPTGPVQKRVTLEVTSVSENYRGYDNVVTILFSDRQKINHIYYDQSGDLLVYYRPSPYYSEASTPGNWARLPFGTKGTVNDVFIDTTYTNSSGLTEEFLVTRDIEYGGEETITQSGRTHNVIVASERLLMRTREIDGSDTTTYATLSLLTYYYDPAIRYFVWIDARTYLGETEDALFRVFSRDVLTDYDLVEGD